MRADARQIDIIEHREFATDVFAMIRRHVAAVPSSAGPDEARSSQLAAEIERITHEAEQAFEKLVALTAGLRAL